MSDQAANEWAGHMRGPVSVSGGPGHPTRQQMIDGLRLLAQGTTVTVTWFIGQGWEGNAADLLSAVADELEGLERQPLTTHHGFVSQQRSPTHCLLVVTRAHQGPVLCNLGPDHPIHQAHDV